MIENVKSLKESIYGLKNEKSKLEKCIKNMEKRSLKTTKFPIETPKEVHINDLGSSVATATSSAELISETSPSTRAFKPSDITFPLASKSSNSDLKISPLEPPVTTNPDVIKPTQVTATKPAHSLL